MPDPNSISAPTPPDPTRHDPPDGAEPSYLRLDRAAVRRLMRQRRLGTMELAKLANVRLGTVCRAEAHGLAPEPSARRIAAALGVELDDLLAGDEEIRLDPAQVEAALAGRSLKQVAAASGWTVSSGALGKARAGAALRRGLARHLAQALGVPLQTLIQEEES